MHLLAASLATEEGQISSTAWPTLIAALGGVLITACFSILTAYLSHRWQNERLKNERAVTDTKEMRFARRKIYAQYIISAQRVYNLAFDLFLANRDNPIDPKDFQIAPPADYYEAVMQNESLRAEVFLIAGPAVEQALADYVVWLRGFWTRAGSGTQLEYDGVINEKYRKLLGAMRKESTELL